MKKFHRILVIILSVSVTLTIVFGVASLALGSNFIYNMYDEVQNSPITMAEFTTDSPVNRLELGDTNFNIEVKKAATAETKVSYPEKYIDVNFFEGRLYIGPKFDSNNIFRRFFPDIQFFDRPDKVIVTIPDTLDSILVGDNVGNTTISGFSIKTLQITEGVGNTKITDGIINDIIDIDGGVGNVELTNITGNALATIENGVGNLTLTNVKTKEMTIDAGVGNVRLQSISTEHLSLTSGIGDIKIQSSTIGVLDGEYGIGSIEISSDTIIGNNQLSKNED